MRRVPHQEYKFTVGALPHDVNHAKPMWPWPSEEEPEEAPEPQRRPLTLLGQIAAWFR